MKPQVGDPAPEFAGQLALPDGTARPVDLKDFRGRRLALVFYPRDATPGCTTQACALRDGWSELEGKVDVIGVSIDPLKSHHRFIEKHSLPYPLLVDEERKLVQAFGVWVEKSMYGRTSMGTERTTFLIGTDGRIEAVLEKVKPKEHLQQLLAALA
ncbi:thioredoxin-dependent thiol peroxidase [Haloferula sargassicola]|uniref:thioredoxin-dependent thiol peroxidase n=1 Tax=Haloferula sargassicola TaxID=490096 RepID=UPI0033654A38